mmetsp:Transcript_3105/g.6228  ORF Transcript_3105/g.6228 Transcript_3105/m.6228 type:complete len:248 (+) Transcript_3105:45-788(+)
MTPFYCYTGNRTRHLLALGLAIAVIAVLAEFATSANLVAEANEDYKHSNYRTRSYIRGGALRRELWSDTKDSKRSKKEKKSKSSKGSKSRYGDDDDDDDDNNDDNEEEDYEYEYETSRGRDRSHRSTSNHSSSRNTNTNSSKERNPVTTLIPETFVNSLPSQNLPNRITTTSTTIPTATVTASMIPSKTSLTTWRNTLMSTKERTNEIPRKRIRRTATGRATSTSCLSLTRAINTVKSCQRGDGCDA